MTRVVSVVVVGAGFSGLAMVSALLKAGVEDLLLLEAGERVGGTWRDNRYPGAACDVPSHLYSLADFPKADWSRRYAGHAELLAYQEDIARRLDLGPRLRTRARLTEARFDEARGLWRLSLEGGEVLEARHVIFGLGPLRDPRWPELEGLKHFLGEVMHSARWDDTIALEGRRVGVLGTGASAAQIIPAIAPRCAALHVFQRTPAWVAHRDDRPYGRPALALLRHVPGLRAALRLSQYLKYELRHPLLFGPAAPLRPLAEAVLRWRLRRQVADPALRDALTPRYRAGCKRILSSSDLYPAMCRKNVSLHTTAVACATPGGLRLSSGEEVALDVLICCTGFHVDRPLGDLEVIGRGGRRLAEVWGARPVAWQGVSVRGFPNAWILLGPNTGLGHNSVLLMAEAQARYIAEAVQRSAGGAGCLELREGKAEAWVAELDAAMQGRAWTSGCASWYLNERGENFTLWPYTVAAYAWRLRRFDVESYQLIAPEDATVEGPHERSPG